MNQISQEKLNWMKENNVMPIDEETKPGLVERYKQFKGFDIGKFDFFKKYSNGEIMFYSKKYIEETPLEVISKKQIGFADTFGRSD